MPRFDTIIAEASRDPRIGDAAGPLVRETEALMTSAAGGLAAFLDRFRHAGMGATVTSWLSPSGISLTGEQVEDVLGALPVTGISGRVGLTREATGAAIGQLIPKLAYALSAGGAALIAPVSATAAASSSSPGIGGWGVAMLTGILGIGVIAWLMQPTPPAAPKPAAQTARPAPVVEAARPTLPAKLDLTNMAGTVTVAGAVHDEATRASIMDMLRAVFGGDKVKGGLTVDAARQPASWLAGLRQGLEAMRIPGLHAVFDGAAVTIDGLGSLADRDRLLGALSAAFGSGMTVSAHLLDKIADMVDTASTATISALSALPQGFRPEALLAILNNSIVNFDSGSFAIPDSAEAVLREAAGKLKDLPPGTKVEIAGYTDNTGDLDGNLKLSGQRAQAVRDFLAKAGADEAALTARGFGADNPVASNDTADGRFRNRRIEYHLAQ